MTTTSPYQFTVWFRWSVSSIDVEQSLDWWCNLSKIDTASLHCCSHYGMISYEPVALVDFTYVYELM